ncbi:AAA family ATPase [archaeon]|nr:AAA family ATPase [archaeon]
MIFINRETELLELENIAKLSEKRLFTTLIYGPRRVGKTELIKHASKSMHSLYFFVYEGKTKESLLKEFEMELKEKGYIDKDVGIKDFDSFIRLLFRVCENTRIIFDEVQYMKNVYPAFFSVLQREIDENQQKKMHFVFLGSIIGLIKKVFEDSKAPLYGRMKSSLNLKPLSYKNVRVFLKKLKYNNEEDFIKFYSVFGGFPKYYTAMHDFNLEGEDFEDVIKYLFFRDSAPLRNEAVFILRSEF